jgi:hypothetical protein
MAPRILSEMSVGLTSEIEAALKIATEYFEVKPSVYARLAIQEKLTREGFILQKPHPMARKWKKAAAANAEIEAEVGP